MTDETAVVFCPKHPTIETSLRCNRCERPMCVKCAVQTPTGYRCKECVSGQQKTFETAEWVDYFLGAGVAGFLSFLGSLIVPRLGFFSILLAPIAGGIIAEAVRFAIRKRRSKRLFQVITASALLGSLPMMLINGFSALFLVISYGPEALGSLFPILWYLVYSIAVTTGVYSQISGLVFKR